MGREFCYRNALQLYLSELGAEVVAESGKASDCYHLGKIILTSLKTHPEWTLQIDAHTKKSESSKSILERSIRCAKSMQRHGVTHGDIVALMAPNHNDLSMPFYAANYLGAAVLPIDAASLIDEITTFFGTANPKMVFCQANKADEVNIALDKVNTKAEIITFDASDKYRCFEDFMNEIDGDVDINGFRATNFDSEDTLCCLIATSGTTGSPKVTSLTHKTFFLGITQFWSTYTKFPMYEYLKAFAVATLQWYTGVYLYYASAIFGFTRVQSSGPPSSEHYMEMIQQYKPTCYVGSPTLVQRIMNLPDSCQIDLSSFNNFFLGGSFVSNDIVDSLKERLPDALIMVCYGMTELSGVVMTHSGFPPKSLGKLNLLFEGKIMNPDTNIEVKKPFEIGELWVKGYALFKGYYNNPEATKDAFSPDGWFMTGDIFYKDDYGYYYYVERKKMILKYRNYQINYRTQNNFEVV